jgi:hypothetical protein
MSKKVSIGLLILLFNSMFMSSAPNVPNAQAQYGVQIIYSSSTEFKVGMNNFIFSFLNLSAGLEPGTYRALATVYHKDFVNYTLGTLGQHGLGFDYFSWATGVNLIEDQDKITAVVKGTRTGYWNYTARFYFFKVYPGLVRLSIETRFRSKNFLGMGNQPQFWAVNQKNQLVSSVYGGLAGWYSILDSVACNSPPFVVGMRNQSGGYIFSTIWLELSGLDSIFASIKDVFQFQLTQNSFGLLTPNNGSITLGTYISGDYLFYVWRDPASPESGLMTFLNAVSAIQGQELTRVDYDNSISAATRVILSFTQPKNVNDIFVIDDGKYYLKAYVGDTSELTKTSTEFISHVNVLLGAAYYYNRTKDPRALSLCRDIMANISNFDVFYLNQNGFYSNNWEPGTLDPWYIITIPSMLINAHAFAPDVVTLNATRLKAHADWLIRFARKQNYMFPVFADPTGAVIGSGTEPDDALAYSYLMTRFYVLYGNATYLNEAEASMSYYMVNLYGHFYEGQLTPMGIAATANLYNYTKDSIYLLYQSKLVYQFSRWMNIQRGLWSHKNVPFALISCMPDSYMAAFEFGLAKLFIEEAAKVAKTSELSAVYNFYTTFSPYTSYYAFPTPLGITSKSTDFTTIKASYWIPIEDIYLDNESAGTIGQEIYGAGSQIIALMPEPTFNCTSITVMVCLPKTVFIPDENVTFESTVTLNQSTTFNAQYAVYQNKTLIRSGNATLQIPISGIYNLTIGKYNVGNYSAIVTMTDVPTKRVVMSNILIFTVERAITSPPPMIPRQTYTTLIGAVLAAIILIIAGWITQKESSKINHKKSS